MGITHNPRPEDWPVMPVYEAGFKLVPVGFSGSNPAMDIPLGLKLPDFGPVIGGGPRQFLGESLARPCVIHRSSIPGPFGDGLPKWTFANR